MAEPLLLGIDLGTSALKCGVWTPRGHRAGLARIPYPTRGDALRPRTAEQSAEDWWRALLAGVGAATAGIDPRRIEALGVGGHAPSPVFADAELAPVAPVLTWLDPRPAVYMERLRRALGRPPASGPERLATQLAARALWLREHAPGGFARARWALGSGDYLAARLTGRPLTTAGPGAPEILAAAGLPAVLLPPRELKPGETAGPLSPAAADALGLPAGIPVVAGGLDSFLGSVGSGISEPGDACLNAGSASVVALVARPPAAGRFTLAGHPLASRPVGVGGRTLERAQALTGSPRPLPELLEEAARRGPGGGLGAGSLDPGELDPGGLERALPELVCGGDPVEAIRRVLTAVCQAEGRVLEELAAAGGPVRRVRLVGGLAALPELGRFRARVLGRAVEVPEETDSGALGAALLAALAAGRFTDLHQAGAAMVRLAWRCEPGGGL
jgi:sugar (pentulose or hexulose) kinase